MRAVWYDRQGAADDMLVCGELPTPHAGHGEVQVRLKACGVNPSDTYRRRGPPAMEYSRVITNSDGAGVIDQVDPAWSSVGAASGCGSTAGSATVARWKLRPNTSHCRSIWSRSLPMRCRLPRAQLSACPR
jgi:NADPH:quinone reductase-like Zn-dependent oxidoreductase